jgi:hypothetical protein
MLLGARINLPAGATSQRVIPLNGMNASKNRARRLKMTLLIAHCFVSHVPHMIKCGLAIFARGKYSMIQHPT